MGKGDVTREEVRELLKSVKYPGFSRDIVSFGLVKDIQIKKSDINVQLQLSTGKQDDKHKIKTDVEEVLKKCGSFESIQVSVTTQSVQQAESAQNPDAVPIPSDNLLPDIKFIIAVASGKGGVGKSTLAVNVAASLSLRKLKVGLLDLDIYGPSLPTLLGIRNRPEITEDKKLIPLEKFGMKVMSFGFLSGNETPVIWRGPLVARMTEQFFTDVLWESLDYLIIDLPPGTGDIQLTLLQKLQISGAIIVTTPQDLAVSDVRKGADMFRKVNAPVLGVVENMSGYLVSGFVRNSSGKPVSDVVISLPQLDGFIDAVPDSNGRFQIDVDLFKRGGGLAESLRLNVPLMGELPISRELMEACDEGIPIVVKDPDSSISLAFSKITDSVEKLLRIESE